MITPIYSPIITQRGPTEREQADEAARKHSTSESARESFRAGAEWHIKKHESAPNFFLMLTIALIAFTWFGAAVWGLMDGPAPLHGIYKFDRPASYIFWPMVPAQKFSRWLFADPER